jgi:hypothetical protein
VLGLISQQARFTEIYQANGWNDRESRSGPGSRRDSGSVADTIRALEWIVRDHAIRSMADIPCGDFNWMPLFLNRHPDLAYRGYDIVPEMIAANRAAHPDRSFEVLDILTQVPAKADLVLCKDLLNHLKDRHVPRALANIRASGARWLLASNNFGAANRAFRVSSLIDSRRLDITGPRFGYPKPVWHTHYLGLWRVADLPG